MMSLLHKVKDRNTTHVCPSCNGRTYCAMLDGKSASTCWCMSVTASMTDYEIHSGAVCRCRKCLTQPDDLGGLSL